MTTTIVPIIIPANREPDKCPSCHRPEDIKRVCRNCGHEYTDEDDLTWWDIVAVFAVVGCIIWFICTIIMWLGESGYSNSPTLVDVLKSQWEFLTKLRVW